MLWFLCGSILTIRTPFIIVFGPQLNMSIKIYFYSMRSAIFLHYNAVVVVDPMSSLASSRRERETILW